VRALKAGFYYFLVVFAAGFALGTLRAVWLAPAIGERAAQLAETPVMLAVVVAAARWIVRRLALEPRLAPRLGMGLAALACMLAAEFGLVLPLRGASVAQYLEALDPLIGAVYYASLGVMAAAPLFVPPAVPRRGCLAFASAVAVLAAASAVVALKYRHDMDAALARVTHGSQIADTKCGPIEYAVSGEGPAVLLVHGAGGGFDQTVGFAQEFAARGFRVVAMSRFGYLRTPRPAVATAAAQADAHACLLDALKIRRAAIIGVSAGGPSSMQFALRHPERCSALVLLVPLAYAPQSAERLALPPASARWMIEQGVKSDLLYWLAAELAPSLVTGSILATPPALVDRADAGERERIAWLRRQILPLSLRQQGLLADVEIAATLARYELERVRAPTLVISARDDRYGTYAGSLYTAQHIAGARFLGLEDGGHLWVGHHREVMGEIVSFLATSAR
jgi:pimeloyl-ACP methyl ester carboxylesterase